MLKTIFDTSFVLLLVAGLIAGIVRFWKFWLRPREERDVYVVSNTSIWRVGIFAVSLFLLFFSVAVLFFGMTLDGGSQDTIAGVLFGASGLCMFVIGIFYKKLWTHFYGISYNKETPSKSVTTKDGAIKAINYCFFFTCLAALVFAGLFYFGIIDTNNESDRLFISSMYLVAALFLFIFRFFVIAFVRFFSRISPDT